MHRNLMVVLLVLCREQYAFIAIAFLMACSGVLQLSFMSRREWTMIRRKSVRHARRFSSLTTKTIWLMEQNHQVDPLNEKYKSCKVGGEEFTCSKKTKYD